jgi:hypothetical protein
MYCPKCAAQNETEMKFCRACGQDLSLVSQALNRQGAVGLVYRISKGLEHLKELQREPRIIRGTLLTISGLIVSALNFDVLFLHHFITWFTALNTLIGVNLLGLGLSEFVKYRRSLVLKEPGHQKPPSVAAQSYGSILNLQSVSESDTQLLATKPRQTKIDARSDAA